MKRVIRAASKVDEFLNYHEDHNNPNLDNGNFDKMYEILSKYGDENETVDVVFERATPEDQDRMLELIKYTRPAKFGTKDYCRELYYSALEGEAYDNKYANQAVVETIDALFACGWINEEDFRTDL